MRTTIKVADFTKWHRWFAWHPVRIEEELIWLEHVERRCEYFSQDVVWYYREAQ